ncbi:hypothetical protein TUMEXPCC7403_07610 [Tumidithrix helvetica PCC 7403]|uniref:CHAT domain-containing protein n=1 Tax=Tumidithrix helvetica TaxID=3457545 RepID=UPI003CAEA3D9
MAMRLKVPQSLLPIAFLPFYVLATLAPQAIAISPAAIAQTQGQTESKNEAKKLYQQGSQLFERQDYAAALTKYQAALRIYQQIGDRSNTALTLMGVAITHEKIGQYRDALPAYEQALKLVQELGFAAAVPTLTMSIGRVHSALGNHPQAIALYEKLIPSLATDKKSLQQIVASLANAYRLTGQFPKAIEAIKQSLTLAKELGDPASQATALTSMGEIYRNLGEYDKALGVYEQALKLRRQLNDSLGIAITLNNIGSIYNHQGLYEKALETFQQTAKQFEALGDRVSLAITFNNIGSVYDDQGKPDLALASYQQALAIQQVLGRDQEQSNTLNNIGGIYLAKSEYAKAFEIFQQALALKKKTSDLNGEAVVLSNIGTVYSRKGEYAKALEFFEQSLTIHKNTGDRSAQSSTINQIGNAYFNLGNYSKSLEAFQQSLALSQAIGDPLKISRTLNNIGLVYSEVGQYSEAIAAYQQALRITDEIRIESTRSTVLNNLGSLYSAIGRYSKAIEFFQQILPTLRKLGDRTGEAIALNNIGSSYDNEEQYDKALEFYQQALKISQTLGDRRNESIGLSNIGLTYSNKGNYAQAQNSLEQALQINRTLGDRASESISLHNLGRTYRLQKQYDRALSLYEQALDITRSIGDRQRESMMIASVATTWDQIGEKELAIAFFKQSVNLRESIRNNLRGLTREDRGAYKQIIAKDYRTLANLLLQQGRVMEALQVLDLLKVQELQDYLQDVKGNERTAKGIELLPQERQLLSDYKTANRATLIAQIKQNAPAFNLQMQVYQDLQDRLKQTSQKVALYYPLLLEDRLELIVFLPNTPPIHRSVKVTQTEMEQAIAAFRSDLQDATSLDAKDSGQKLYKWLIAPIAQDLQQTQTILYAPDGQMRYIPLAALYDGNQWLIERYAINQVTSASLTDLAPRPFAIPRVIAGAFTRGEVKLEVSERKFAFSGLPFAGREVEGISSSLSEVTSVVNQDFDRNSILSRLKSHNIMHLATHAAFVQGTPEDSFILLGNGDRFSLREVQNWKLENIDLVVLSACQTAVGGKLGNGEEILGFGYQMQRAGAKAAIASLWTVSDGGTQALMDLFYGNLRQSKFSKVEALHQAQLSLLRNKSLNFSHPYYWSAFILIGNGL